VNIAFPDKSLLDREDIQAFIQAQTEDLGAKGRLSIRPSGTEPKVRVMVEAADAESRAKAIAEGLSALAGKVSP
jgi:phosphoglucosamine mutase